jgi:AAA domain-containing protein
MNIAMDSIDKDVSAIARMQAPPTAWPPKYRAAEFIKLPVIKPMPLIDGLLDGASRIMLGGGSKTFKTWLLLDLATSQAAGVPWLLFKAHATPTLYVNFELEDYYFQQRLDAIWKAKEIPPPHNLIVWNMRNQVFGLAELIEDLVRFCQTEGIKVVFIDPFYKLLKPNQDENRQTDMADVLAQFAPLNALGAAIVFAMHYSKGNQADKDPMDRISGAGSLARDPDNLILLTRHQVDFAFVLDFVVRNKPPIKPFVVQWKHPLLRQCPFLDPADLKIKKTAGAKKKVSLDKLLAFLKEHDDQWLVPEFVDHAAARFDISKRTCYRLFEELREARKVCVSETTEHVALEPTVFGLHAI